MGTAAAESVIYVGNAGQKSVSEYSMGSGAVRPMGRPIALPSSAPSAVATTPAGNLLYVAAEDGSIYQYRTGSNGSLQQGSGRVVAHVSHPIRMVVDHSGAWLFVASSASPTLQGFHIDTAHGALLPAASASAALSSPGAAQIYMTPDNHSLFVALGKSGIDAFSFDSRNGVLGSRSHVTALQGRSSDTALASDASSRMLFVGEAGTGIRALRIVTDGLLEEISSSPVAIAGNPVSMAVNSARHLLLVATRNSSQIAEFSFSRDGALNPVSGAMVHSAVQPAAIAADAEGNYLVSIPSAAISTGSTSNPQLFPLQ